jgi:hypothetical protein
MPLMANVSKGVVTMSEQPVQPQGQGREPEGVEDVDVPQVPEPDQPDEGELDPGDTHVEGVDAGEAGDPQ